MSDLTEEQFALSAAAQAFCNRGITIACPWEGDLDDAERERFDALVAAVECYNTAIAVAPAFMPPAPIPSHEHPIRDRGEPVAWRWKAHGHEDGPWIVVHDGATAGAAMALFASKGKPNRVEPLYASLPPARVEEGPRVKALGRSFKTDEEAKAAAEADYAARIRGALE